MSPIFRAETGQSVPFLQKRPRTNCRAVFTMLNLAMIIARLVFASVLLFSEMVSEREMLIIVQTPCVILSVSFVFLGTFGDNTQKSA